MTGFRILIIVLALISGGGMAVLGIGADAMSDSPSNHGGLAFVYAGVFVVGIGLLSFFLLR